MVSSAPMVFLRASRFMCRSGFCTDLQTENLQLHCICSKSFAMLLEVWHIQFWWPTFYKKLLKAYWASCQIVSCSSLATHAPRHADAQIWGLHPSSPSSHSRLQWTHMDSMSSALHLLDTRLLHAATVTRQRSLCIALYVHDGALDYCICASWQEVLWSKRTWNDCLNHGIQACWLWSCLLTSFH